MIEATAVRPVPLSRVWSGSRIIAENLEGDDLADVLQYHADASIWWVLPRESGSQLHELMRGLDLSQPVIDDLLSHDRRVKYDEFRQSRLVALTAVSFDPGQAQLTTHASSVVLSERVLICLADRRPGVFDPAKWLADSAPRLAADGADAALQVLIMSVIKSYQVVVEWLEAAADSLAEALFEERPLTKAEQLWVFKLRAMLAQLRRLTEPMRTVVGDLAQSYANDEEAVARQWMLIDEQHHRVANAADELRETLASVFDTSSALADLRGNQIMKKLTGWAAIVAVPTLVTGFVGMNVQFPLDATEPGFYVYLIIMIIPVLLLFWLFRRKQWI